MPSSPKRHIITACRASPLSKKGAEEVLQLIRSLDEFIFFDLLLQKTYGDKDLKTCLKDMPKNDFFTKEIDELLVSKRARIAIHSAKDLPIPLPKGLYLAALTESIAPEDLLVLRDGDSLESLRKGALIGTSSIRREKQIHILRPDLICTSIRGTIEKRLEQLFQQTVDGLVIAKAALLRLNLLHLNHILLPPPYARYQGRLAVVTRDDDEEMIELFKKIDQKKRLHFGLSGDMPLIETKIQKSSIPLCKEAFHAKHLLFTSKEGVRYFVSALKELRIDIRHICSKHCFSIGKGTTRLLRENGFQSISEASTTTSEGLLSLIEEKKVQGPFFWPHSALSRTFFQKHLYPLIDCPLYTTHPKKPQQAIDFSLYDELFFSSPSIIDSFFACFEKPPEDMFLAVQGPITYQRLQAQLQTKGVIHDTVFASPACV